MSDSDVGAVHRTSTQVLQQGQHWYPKPMVRSGSAPETGTGTGSLFESDTGTGIKSVLETDIKTRSVPEAVTGTRSDT